MFISVHGVVNGQFYLVAVAVAVGSDHSNRLIKRIMVLTICRISPSHRTSSASV